MPVRRKRGRSLNKQESHKIRTRLIEISLKVEDCIYQKIPISMMEANSFIKEVTSYKLECSKDERSLQVIEKLIRCMKAIIIEHEESRTADSNLYEEVRHVDNGAASPVYSLPEEDRTQMTQELIEPSSVNLFDEPTTIHNNNMKDTEEIDSVADNGNKVHAVIDHCDIIDDITMMANETTERVATSKTTIDVDIQKALSNLSLENVDQEETTFPDIECSQSILNNFQELDELQQKHKSNVESTDTQVIDNTLKTDVQKSSQFQTINLLAKKPVIIPDTRRIVKSMMIPSLNVPAVDLTKRSTNPLTINNASRTIQAAIVPSSNVTTVDLSKTSIKPLDINDANRTIKAINVPSSNVNMVDLTKKSTKTLTVNEANRTTKASIVPSSNANTVDLTKTPTKSLTINDSSRTVKATIVPSLKVNTEDLNKKYNKHLIIPDTSGKANATILPSSNVMTSEKFNKASNIKNPPLLNVPNVKKKINCPKATTQNVAQQFGYTVPTNTIYTHPYNNNISSTIINATNSYEQYNAASTYNKNLDIKNKVQENIASKNASAKKKRGPRKNKVIKTTDNVAEKRASDKITNKIIKKPRRPRVNKVNAECNLNHKDSNVPIYNNFIENDLSWLENIRFVREIRDDEIDSKLSYLSENFWDNYDLLPNFDEGDFL